jgi:hypothetical protein
MRKLEVDGISLVLQREQRQRFQGLLTQHSSDAIAEDGT